MKKCGLLGRTLNHSYSPFIHRQYGDYAYELYEKYEEEVEDFLKNGNWAYGSFRWFPKKTPMIRVASAIETELLQEYTLDELHEQILSSLVHEITHYYQWISKLEQSNATSERQANYFRYRIIEQYDLQTSESKKIM